MAKHQKKKSPAPQPQSQTKKEPKLKKKPLLLPYYLVLFVLVWAWAAFWYGDVFRIAREYSFWAPDSTLMYYEEGRPWGELWKIGLALLQTYRWPMLGALLTSLFVTGSTYLVGYCLRLRGWWRLLQYLPAALLLGLTAYIGFDLYFESETGMIMGVPFLCFIVMLILAAIIRSFSKHSMPSLLKAPEGETPKQNRSHLLAALLVVLIPMGITHWMRPYVRVVTTMQRQLMEQDFKGMAKTAQDHSELSYRQIAAYYAIALVQTGRIGEDLFNIRLDYDDPYLHGFDGHGNNASNYYMMDCDFHAGLFQTCIHHGMEQMTMNGPSIRTLKVLTKCALLNGEWEVAEKYFAILKKVPFEGQWISKYEPMLRNTEKIDSDPEFKMVRLTEPLHDSFENTYIQPTFLGYNAALLEGKSINALWNSLAVHIYTKTMPQFVRRCEPLVGSTPPRSFSEALSLMAGKDPNLMQAFPSIQNQSDRLRSFVSEIKPIPKDSTEKAEKARELFTKYKGYYPYYYFFGNLKATKKKANTGTSNSGVN